VIVALVVQPCLGQTNYVKIGPANVVIKCKLFDPETSNVLIANVERVAEIWICHG
jgi:hypothetical protein